MNRFFRTFFLLKLIAGCSHSPEGAPVSTQVANVAKDTIAIASGKAYAVSSLPQKLSGISTRIELMVLGIMTCSTVVSQNFFFEIVNEEKKVLASGGFNANWQAIFNANLVSGKHYIVRLKLERTGESLEDFTFLYSGVAPWQIQVTARCPR
jgi:hypothetical protein